MRTRWLLSRLFELPRRSFPIISKMERVGIVETIVETVRLPRLRFLRGARGQRLQRGSAVFFVRSFTKSVNFLYCFSAAACPIFRTIRGAASRALPRGMLLLPSY